MRKNIFIGILALLGIAACQKQNSYTINGQIGGNAEGKMVFLYNLNEMTPFDSAVVKDGKFTFTGTKEHPARIRLVIDNNAAEQKGNKKGWLASVFYLENSKIDYIANVDSMPGFFWNPDKKTVAPTVKGSKNQDLYLTYTQSVKDYSEKLEALNEEYLIKYHRPAMNDTMNTEVGIALVKKTDSLKAQLEGVKMDFIRKNASTPVAFDMVKNYFEDMYVNISADKIDELMNALRPKWKDKENFLQLEKAAESAKKIAVGSKFTDVSVQNEKGETVKLSQYIQPGKYTLLEFWATWCGPCRAEIPHLKYVYNEYKNKNFDIVSISFDDNTADWEKAKKEESMNWTQALDTKNFDGESAQTYKILGIPYSLLLDPEGKIIGTDMRGAHLDRVLQERIAK